MQTVRFVNTLDGFEITNNVGDYLDYFEELSRKINFVYLVYTKRSHLVTNDIALAWEFATLLLPNTPDDITIKVFDKSETDEVMILASKIHNVDLIPIHFTKN